MNEPSAPTVFGAHSPPGAHVPPVPPLKPPGPVASFIGGVGHVVLQTLAAIGRYGTILLSLAGLIFARPYRLRNLFKQMEIVGFQSLSIVCVTGLFTGMVFAVQLYIALIMFGAAGLVGATVGLSLTRELSPVFCALMVTGRVGSAMAATIGSMKVSEQVDALNAMAVNPIHYLMVPRVLAATLMMPLLVLVFDTVGIGGAYLVGVKVLNVDPGTFINKLWWFVDPDDFWKGMIKGGVFGLIFSVVGCTKGYYTEGGAEGVGKATTEAVVVASVTILVVDYFLTRMMW